MRYFIVDDSYVDLEEKKNINETEPEKESITDIIKDFKDTESINDRYLLKLKKTGLILWSLYYKFK